MPETKKYSVIYADPPWRYDMKRGNGVAENLMGQPARKPSPCWGRCPSARTGADEGAPF